MPLAALYAGMLTKVGVYVLLRVFGTVLPHDLHFAHELLAWLAGVTMVLAVIGAISRNFIRGILSFHILSQIGFMVLAIGFFTPLAYRGGDLLHHPSHRGEIVVVPDWRRRVVREPHGRSRPDGQPLAAAPWLGVLFLCQALSLAGLPPLSGFWGKYLILVVGIEGAHYCSWRRRSWRAF